MSYYSYNGYDMDDYTWDIAEIVKLHDPEIKDDDIVAISGEDRKKIKKRLRDIESLFDDVVSDYNSAEEEKDDLQNRVDDLSESENIPDEISRLFADSRYDLGTVIELKEKIAEILKNHGYNAG